MKGTQVMIVVPDGASLVERINDDALFAIAAELMALDELDDSGMTWSEGLWRGLNALNYMMTRDPHSREQVTGYTGGWSEELSAGNKRTVLQRERMLVVELLRRVLGRPDMQREEFLGLKTLSHEDAIARFQFPMGTPSSWVAYKPHPLDPSLQVPLAQFHQFMLRDKKAEFLRIASALGAKSIQIVDAKTTRSAGGAHGGLDTAEGKLGAKAKRTTANEESFSLDFGSDSPPWRAPYVPGSTRWVQSEPLWQAMIETRLEQWATRFRVSFRYTSEYGLTAEVAAGLEGLGFSIGGSYEEQESVDNEHVVEFWPRESYGDIE